MHSNQINKNSDDFFVKKSDCDKKKKGKRREEEKSVSKNLYRLYDAFPCYNPASPPHLFISFAEMCAFFIQLP